VDLEDEIEIAMRRSSRWVHVDLHSSFNGSFSVDSLNSYVREDTEPVWRNKVTVPILCLPCFRPIVPISTGSRKSKINKE
jgi:hypothetical protein